MHKSSFEVLLNEQEQNSKQKVDVNYVSQTNAKPNVSGCPCFTNQSKMTEEQIKDLGWKLVKQYNHDQYHTNRYKLGCMEIEFTYEGKELLTHDVTISELNCMPISFNQAKMLTELLGHWSD